MVSSVLTALSRRHHATSRPSNVSRAPNSSTAAASSIAVAIPCFNYYELYPEDAGPMANMVLHSAEELRVWRLVAMAVSEEVALRDGGCVVFHGCGVDITADSALPVYLKINPSDDEVYGRAAYITKADTAEYHSHRRATARAGRTATAQRARGSGPKAAAADATADDDSVATPSCAVWTDGESDVALPSTCRSDCSSCSSSCGASRGERCPALQFRRHTAQ